MGQGEREGERENNKSERQTFADADSASVGAVTMTATIPPHGLTQKLNISPPRPLNMTVPGPTSPSSPIPPSFPCLSLPLHTSLA